MAKMAAMPIYDDHLRSQWTDFHETRYVASGTRGPSVCSNDGPRMIITIYDKVQFCKFIGFSMGKNENNRFF